MTGQNEQEPIAGSGPGPSRGGLTALFSPRRFALALIILIVASYPGVIFGGQYFFLRDYGLFGYPLAFYHRQAFWRGEIPLWNPLNSGGLPFLAQWNTLTLYPFSAIYLLLPLPWSLGFYCLFHLFLAGMGMYFLTRRWSGNAFAASLAGVGYAFNGLALNSLAWPNNIAAIAWMPWILLCVEKAWRKGGKYTAVAALTGAAQMLSGAPEMILCTWFLVGLIFLFQLRGARPKRRLFLRLSGVVILVAALASAQLLPFLDLLLHSQRDSQFGANSWSMPPWGWANLLSPLFRCYRSPLGVFFQSAQHWTSSYYLGFGILLLAVCGIPTRSTYSIPLGLATLFGLIMALGEGGWLYPVVLKFFPVLGFMRFPIKFVILPMYAVPVLAALGARECLVRLGEPGRRIPRRIMVAFTVFSLIALFLAFFSELHPYVNELPDRVLLVGLTRIVIVAALLISLVFSQRAQNTRTRGGLAFAALFCVWLDAFTHAPNQNPTAPSAAFEPGLLTTHQVLKPTPLFGQSRAMMSHETHDRLYTAMLSDPQGDYIARRASLFGNCNLLDSLPVVDGFYSLYIRAQREVWSQMFWQPTNSFPDAAADFLGVSQLTSRQNNFEWESRPHWQPLVSIGRRPVFVKSDQILGRFMGPGFDPSRLVLISEDYSSIVPASPPTRARVISGDYQAEKISVEVESDAAAVVTIAQTYYHPWQARVDGAATTLFPVNHAFQGLVTPAGRHHIELIYVDDAFRGGLLLSAGGLLACFWTVWRFGRRRNNSPA